MVVRTDFIITYCVGFRAVEITVGLVEHHDFGKLDAELESVIVTSTCVLFLFDLGTHDVIWLKTDDVDAVVLALPIRLVLAIWSFHSRPNLHSLRVERCQVASDVENIEICLGLRLPVEHLEVEPIGVSHRVRIDFAEEVIVLLVHQVNGVKIARLKVTVKLQQLFLINVAW